MAEPLQGIVIAMQCRSGNERTRDQCFRRIWNAYYPRLVVFVRSGQETGTDDEDLVQEIMEKVWRGIRTYDPAWRFSTWVYAIARNACRDRTRRRRARPQILPLSGPATDATASGIAGPEEELIRGETERLVARFFATVDPETRQIAFLRFHERMGYRGIASAMGIAVGTAKFRVHAIRGRLKAALEEGHADRRAIRTQAF